MEYRIRYIRKTELGIYRFQQNKCKSCISQIQNAKHLMFECMNVQNVWKVASCWLNFDILWKHIVVGFYLDKSETTKIYNSFVSYIAYGIYKSKMYCKIE